MDENAAEVITDRFREYYARLFREYGPTPPGVDWAREEDLAIRYEKMLAVVLPDSSEPGAPGQDVPVSLLDVGCGYGGLYRHARDRGLSTGYMGIDLVESMIQQAERDFPEARFHCRDVLSFVPDGDFDYVVCNGVLTLRLEADLDAMDRFSHQLVKRMFDLCRKGAAFNMRTTRVNITFPELYYRSPVEMFAYCFAEFTNRIKIDHSYSPYEYTLYLYK